MRILKDEHGAEVVFPFYFFRGYKVKGEREHKIARRAEAISFIITALLALLFVPLYGAAQSYLLAYVFLILFLATIWIVRGLICILMIEGFEASDIQLPLYLSLKTHHLKETEQMSHGRYWLILILTALMVLIGLFSNHDGAFIKSLPFIVMGGYLLYAGLDPENLGSSLKERLDLRARFK